MTSWVKFHALICHHCLGPNLTPSAQSCREPSAAKTVTAMSLAPNLVLEQIQSRGWSGTLSSHQIITLMETSEVGDSQHLAVPGMEAEEAKSCWNSWHSSCVRCSGWGRFICTAPLAILITSGNGSSLLIPEAHIPTGTENSQGASSVPIQPRDSVPLMMREALLADALRSLYGFMTYIEFPLMYWHM